MSYLSDAIKQDLIKFEYSENKVEDNKLKTIKKLYKLQIFKKSNSEGYLNKTWEVTSYKKQDTKVGINELKMIQPELKRHLNILQILIYALHLNLYLVLKIMR